MNNDDPLMLLRRHYSLAQVRQVYEQFDQDAAVPLCRYFAEARGDVSELWQNQHYGLQQMRRTSYRDLPLVLEALGGVRGMGVRGRKQSGDEHFWPITAHGLAGPVVDRGGQQERLTMLAFMVTWLEGDDDV